MKKFVVFIYQTLLSFAFLGVLFIPFSFRNWNFQYRVTMFLFEDVILLLAAQFDWIHIVNKEITSDSTTLYLLVFLLFCVAIILNLLFRFFNFWKQNHDKIFKIIQLVLTYYLSLILLKYGFDKIFKAQFYLPEPNTLFTPLGMLDKDILYWSTLGVSHSYNVFMGMFEGFPALMLLNKKTRILGLFIVSGVLVNVVFINFGFDISVKLFSSFLLLTSLILLAPSFKSILKFFILSRPTSLPYLTGQAIIASNVVRFSLKAIIIIFIFTESLLPYLKSGQYNDDKIPRIYMHGAYEVLSMVPIATEDDKKNIKRFFIHRNSYFIFQYEDDSMEDFYLEINTNQNEFQLTNYKGETLSLNYAYSKISRSLEIKSVTSNWVIQAKAINWQDLPLVQPLFHWTVD